MLNVHLKIGLTKIQSLKYMDLYKSVGHAVFAKQKNACTHGELAKVFLSKIVLNMKSINQKMAINSLLLTKWGQAFLLRKTASPAVICGFIN